MTRRRTLLDSYLFFARSDPVRSVVTVVALVLAGFMEGVGAAGILSLLTIVLNESGSGGFLANALNQLFALFGVAPTWPNVLTLLVVLAIAKAAFNFFALAQAGITATNVAADLRISLLRALLQARWTFFAHHSVGESANAIATEAHRASMTFLTISQALASLILVLAYAATAFLISWQVSIMALSMGALLAAGLAIFIRRAREAGERQTKTAKRLVANFTSAFSGIKAIKAMNRLGYFSRKLEADMLQLRGAQRKQIIYEQLLTGVAEPAMLTIVAIGLYLALTFSNLAMSELLVLGLIALRIMQRTNVVQAKIQRAATTESALWSLLDARTEAQSAHEEHRGKKSPSLVHHLELNKVSFSYPGQPIINDVSLNIQVPSFVTLLGPSGSGKTTLIDMIIGLLKPQSGQVLLDGIPLDNIDLEAWRRRIGYVPQDTYLFHDTILNNVAMGDETIDAQRAEDALRTADAWHFIASLPKGLETVVGEGGSRLSGGQRQRIAIARAVATNPLLLVLDEATSALDRQSEQEILQTIRKIAQDVTVIAVAHNPAIAEAADATLDLTAFSAPSDRHLLAASPINQGGSAATNRSHVRARPL